MDTHECQPLYLEIQEFYEGLNMKVEQQVPLLLVEKQALNEAMEGEKHVTNSQPHRQTIHLLKIFSSYFIILVCAESPHAGDSRTLSI